MSVSSIRRLAMGRKAILPSILLILLFGLDVFAQQFSGIVVGVTDGDTIQVNRSRRVVRVRLHGIDSPENRQAFSDQATRFTSQLAFGKMVTVYVMDKDRYGRTVGVVVLSDGKILNHEIVKA